MTSPALKASCCFLFSGLEDWGEDAVLHQVLAASQQEYLDSLKQRDSGETEQETGTQETERQERQEAGD